MTNVGSVFPINDFEDALHRSGGPRLPDEEDPDVGDSSDPNDLFDPEYGDTRITKRSC